MVMMTTANIDEITMIMIIVVKAFKSDCSG